MSDIELDELSLKAIKVIGLDVAFKMSPQQKTLFSRALDRLLDRHNGDVNSVTAEEIEGQYEQIVTLVLPTGSYELLLDQNDNDGFKK